MEIPNYKTRIQFNCKAGPFGLWLILLFVCMNWVFLAGLILELNLAPEIKSRKDAVRNFGLSKGESTIKNDIIDRQLAFNHKLNWNDCAKNSHKSLIYLLF